MKRPAKRRRGRPATGRDISIATRFPRETLEQVTKYAKRNNLSRSEAIRRLIERGLADLNK
jgi:hypothetical protein